MSDYDRKVGEDYAVFEGVVVACQPGNVRVRAADGASAAFVTTRQAPSLQPGVAVRIVFLRDDRRAVYVVDRGSGRHLAADFWRDGGFSYFFNQGGFGPLGRIGEILSFLMLLVPFLGQFAAFANLIVVLVLVVVQPKLRGTPSFSYGRSFASLALYAVGSIVFFSGWSEGEDGTKWFGFLLIALGAFGYAIWARRPAKLYHQALKRLVERGDAGFADRANSEGAP